MSVSLAIYRNVTSAMESTISGLVTRLGSPEWAWRAGFRGASEETRRASGSVWVHAASLGEIGAARIWIESLLANGCRPPVLLTTRTRAGLAGARDAKPERVASRIAPHDFPRVLGSFLEAARPRRIDVIETELWPNLIAEARRRAIPMVFVSATVSERTTGWLGALGIAGSGILAEGVYALPQSERFAAHFHMLGVPLDRIRVVGDLKAESTKGFSDPPRPFDSRPALVFGSLRTGEERTARRVADLLEAHRRRSLESRVDGMPRREDASKSDGRSRALLVIAPRHREGEARVRAAFRWSGFRLAIRDEASRGDMDVAAWVEEVSHIGSPRVALLATRGELAGVYASAWGGLVGGTFAPLGGHNVWEAAARSCPVIVGPWHEGVSAAVEAIVREGGGVVVGDGERTLERVLSEWLADSGLERRGLSAVRAAAGAGGATARALEALASWGLGP